MFDFYMLGLLNCLPKEKKLQNVVLSITTLQTNWKTNVKRAFIETVYKTKQTLKNLLGNSKDKT